MHLPRHTSSLAGARPWGWPAETRRRAPLAAAVPQRRGFSLIEIMVAVAILAVMIVGLLAMFYTVQRAFRSGTAQVDVMESGRSTMGVIARELAEMTATYHDGVTNFHFTTSPGYVGVPTTMNLLGGVQRANALHDMTFVRRANDEWLATAYRIQYADSGVGTLYRMVTNDFASKTNFDLGSMCFAVCTTNLPSYDPTARPAPVQTNGFYPVLEGVVHFRIDVSDTDGNFYPLYTITNLVPYTVVGDSQVGRYIVSGDETKGYAFTGSALPAFVDVELAVLEPAALTRFKYRAESDVPGYPKARAYLAEQAGRLHVFRQRIPIRAASADIGAGP